MYKFIVKFIATYPNDEREFKRTLGTPKSKMSIDEAETRLKEMMKLDPPDSISIVKLERDEISSLLFPDRFYRLDQNPNKWRIIEE